ncbi:MAG: hypothetical protein BGO70_12095 [Bacteroidetes bacterium 43-93]|nr:hypothetical protein [Bacteroidota bacterium]OJW98197.1 MAG: hypothetical protein BGO70_12095 [Bacteroidetes bacterium 43-93]
MIGQLLQWLINVWLAITGRVRRFTDHPWLRGPVGDGKTIGDKYYDTFAAANGYNVTNTTDGGLLRDFKAVLSDKDIAADKLNKRIIHFYEHTVQYKLEVWSQWYKPMSFFAKILIRTISTRMNQMNIPLEPLETSRGMSNEVLHIKDKVTDDLLYACWLRKSILSGRVVYAGFYSACLINDEKFVRVIFPLPDGNVTVLLKAIVQEDGSVKLISKGRHFGDAGYYRVRRHNPDSVKVRHIPLTESIHVFEDNYGVLRTDHVFWFMGFKLLHLHYKIMER